MHIGWNQPLATGNEAIDSLQLELFRRATHLIEAARTRQAAEARAHVARVTELARHLFQSEEQILREAGSPSLERHAREHQRFLSDLQVDRHVLAWLEAHVGQTDRDLDRAIAPSARA